MTIDVGSPSGTRPLVVLEALFGALSARGVDYCHWKSNSHLAAAVTGETDLDLLVDRDRAEDFRGCLAEHDFKPLDAAPGKHYPLVENYLGFDERTGRLVHLHVHYQLILGQQHVKDYRLPIERELLASVRDLDGTPTPSADVELIVLSIRAVLKYRLRDAVKDLLPGSRSGIPRAILGEAEWLLAQTSLDGVHRILTELAGSVPSELVDRSIRLLTSPTGRVRGLRVLVLRERVRSALRPTRRISRAAATRRYVTALARKRGRSLKLVRKHRMTPRRGGVTIAFIGSDGSGKSTVISELVRWLSWRLDVVPIYMGTAQPAWGTRLIGRLAKLMRAVDRRVAKATGRERLPARFTGVISDHTTAVRRLAEARTRLRRFNEAQHHASAGAIVLFDRYPLATVPVYGRSMDGPRIEHDASSPDGRLIKRLGERERDLYRRIEKPDAVIVLTVSPAESLLRKPDHDPAGIEAKTAGIGEFIALGSDCTVIDADRPLDRVLTDAKLAAWGLL